MATAYWFGTSLKGFFDGTANSSWDWDTDTIKVSLHSNTAPNQDTHDFFDDVSASELAATGGYTSGGATLTGKSVTYTGGTNKIAFIATDPQWTSASFTAYYAVIYKSTGVASTSPLIGYIDLGGAQTVTSGTFTLDFDGTNGVLSITLS